MHRLFQFIIAHYLNFLFWTLLVPRSKWKLSLLYFTHLPQFSLENFVFGRGSFRIWEVLHLRRQNKTKILRIQWTHPVLLQIFSHINVISDSYASLSCLSLSLSTEQSLTWLIFEVKLEFSTIDYICLLVRGNNFIELAVRKIHCLAFTENFQRSLYKQKTSRKNFCDLESRT